jgi:quercetin dioxygenase-like cupin family protein
VRTRSMKGEGMKSLGMRAGLALAIFCSDHAGSRPALSQEPGAGSHGQKQERARVVFSQRLPEMNSKQLKASLVEVSYGPGESSTPHSHPCPVLVYVLEGAVRTQVKGGMETVYHVGESFYEAPNGVHLVSANASATSPAKMLAYFLCDHDAPLSSSVPASNHKGRKQ